MKKWFLYRVSRLNKGLFIFFLLFITATLITNLSGWEASPFFVWGMYSEKEKEVDTRPVIKVTVNDSLIIDNTSGYSDANRFYLSSPLHLFLSMKETGLDPTAAFLLNKNVYRYGFVKNAAARILNGSREYDAFLSWYQRYLQQTTGITVRNYSIEILNAVYTADNRIQIISSLPIASWKP
jgi:hypothetical protein